MHRTEIAAARPDDPAQWRQFEHRSGVGLLALGHDLLGCAPHSLEARSDCSSPTDRFMVAWALLELHRSTDDDRYRRAAAALIETLPRQPSDAFAIGWLLMVASDAEAAALRPDLVDAADAAARRELARLQSMDDHELGRTILFGHAENASWTLARLQRWAEHRRDVELAVAVRELVQTRWLDPSVQRWCPLAVDRVPEPGEFVSPCLARAGAVVPGMEPIRAAGWVRQFVGADAMLEPQRMSSWPADPALNFTRAVTLWELHRATGSVELRDAYAAHVEAGLSDLEARRAAGEPIAPRLAAWAAYAVATAR